MFKYIKKILSGAFCLSCGTILTGELNHVCNHCLNKTPLTSDIINICTYCHDLKMANSICNNCSNQTPPWKQLYTVFSYKEHIKKLFILYKLRDSVLAERDLVRILRPHLEKFSDRHIIAAPCSKATKRRLGFNPVSNIIKQIHDDYSEPILNKSSKTAKSLDRDKRKSQKAKMTIDISKINKNKKLLIVDDVFTTGSTMHRVSELLIANGIEEFEVLCFFRS